MITVWILILFSSCSCSAVIYHLNDTEYQRMPPVFSLDEYESCLVEEGSTYCMLQLSLSAEPGNQLMHMITEYSKHTPKHFNHSLIDRGVCVRKTCHKYVGTSNTTEDLARSLEACLNDSLRREYGLDARVSKLYYCNRHNEPVLIDAWDWAVLAVILGLVTINIVGSSYDYFLRKQTKKNSDDGNAVLLSFSMMRNWKWLTNTEIVDSKMRDMQFLHGVRFTSSMCIVLGHAMMGVTIGFVTNLHDIEKSYEHPLYQVMYNGFNTVQIFFFLSGLLVVYKLLIMERTFTTWDIPKILLLRLIRLVPVLSMTLALTTTWVRHAGSGPLWKLYVTDSLVADCRANGWYHLLFLNNYLQKINFCVGPTWHLAADMQVYLVCITAYIVVKQRRMMLGALLLISIAVPALHTVLQDLDTLIFTPALMRDWESRNFWLQHCLGHNNLPCFIIGMATASILYDWQKKGGNLVKNRWYSLLHYVGVFSIMLSFYTGQVFYRDAPRAPLLARAFYNSAIRVLLGISCAILISSLFTKTSSYIKSFFEWRCWIVAGRLSYCVFLLHMIFVHIVTGVKTQMTYYSFFTVVSSYFTIVVASYLVSVPFCLMVEAPFSSLFKTLFMKHKIH